MKNNNPYHFLNSSRNCKQLTLCLQKFGLEPISVIEEYRKVTWKLNCSWIHNEEIALVWNKEFWSDGMNE